MVVPPRGANRLVQRFIWSVLQPVAAQARHGGQLPCERCKHIVSERREPSAVELEALRIDAARNVDEASQSRASRVRALSAEGLQTNRMSEAVGVEADAERH